MASIPVFGHPSIQSYSSETDYPPYLTLPVSQSMYDVDPGNTPTEVEVGRRFFLQRRYAYEKHGHVYKVQFYSPEGTDESTLREYAAKVRADNGGILLW